MSLDAHLLNDKKLAGPRFTAPRSEAEAEAMLRQMAGPFSSVAPARGSAQTGPLQQMSSTLKGLRQPSATRSIAAVEKFREAYDAVPDAVLVSDHEGTIALANSSLEKLFGYSREELVGQMVETVVPDRYRNSHPAKRQTYFADPEVRVMGAGQELHGRHRDGHEIPVEISISPLKTSAGLMVVATIRDLSQQRKVESQIRRFEARYRTLVEGLPAVTFMAALDGEVNELYVSPQIETLLGFSQAEWLSNPILWYTQLHPDDRKRWHTEFAVTCSTGTTFNSIYRFYSRNGRVVWVHGQAKVIRDDAGSPLFLQGVAFDITQLKEAEHQLRDVNQTLESRVQERTAELLQVNDSLHVEIQERQRIEEEVRRVNVDLAFAHEQAIAADQAKSQFLANMSHELRTPLNAIIGYSELLQILSLRKKDTSFVPDLERINKAGKHLLTLINDILDISKIEAGKMQLELEVFDVRSIVVDVVDTVRPLAAANANQLTIEIADDLAPIQADVVRLKQCLLNLLSNACKFTQSGTVNFTVHQESTGQRDDLIFRVTDTGIGLSDAQAARLFQPFTQADASTTRKFGGTGLGLAITKKLCEAMGGDISLASQIGAGSVFTIRLPIYQPPQPAK